MFRVLTEKIVEKTDKVKVLLGPRQVGKTTLLKNSFPEAFYINSERSEYSNILNSKNIEEISKLIELEGAKKLLILDEVQRLEDPGLIAKLIHDEIPDLDLIISGSSALEIAYKASESLAGRKITYKLFPLTFSEHLVQNKLLKEPINPSLSFENLDKKNLNYERELKEAMVYGLYPEILSSKQELREKFLYELVDSVILKDILFLNLIKNTKKIVGLLKLLAYQIGQAVNCSEIAARLGISRQTVVDYIQILEQTFIIYRLSPFTKKRRDEIGRQEKIYFYDLGIRNALIGDFSPVEYRRDFGHIFENFVLNEIMKINSYYDLYYGIYYWRTKWGSEVDIILDKNGKQTGIEVKLTGGKVNKAWRDSYPESENYVITLDNLSNLIL